MAKTNGRKRTTNASQTGDQVHPPAEEDGEGSDWGEDWQEEKVKHVVVSWCGNEKKAKP